MDEILGYEKELLGFYVSGHPLDSYRGNFESSKLTKLAALEEVDTSAKPITVFIAGIVNTMEVRYSKKDNRPFATFTFEDFTGQTEIMAWSDDFEKHKETLKAGAVLGLRCRCSKDQRTEQNRLTLSDAKPLKPRKARSPEAGNLNGNDKQAEEPKPKEVKPVLLRLNARRHSNIDLARIKEVLEQHPGEVPVLLDIIRADGGVVRLQMGDQFRVEQTRRLIEQLHHWLA